MSCQQLALVTRLRPLSLSLVCRFPLDAAVLYKRGATVHTHTHTCGDRLSSSVLPSGARGSDEWSRLVPLYPALGTEHSTAPQRCWIISRATSRVKGRQRAQPQGAPTDILRSFDVDT